MTTRPLRYLLDLALVVWVGAWIVAGVSVSRQVEGLTHLSDTVTNVGGALDAAGNALDSLTALPLVGDRVKAPAQEVHVAGQSALSSGRSSRRSIHNLSGLLGWAVALIPSVPIAVVYLTLRFGRFRVVRVDRRRE